MRKILTLAVLTITTSITSIDAVEKAPIKVHPLVAVRQDGKEYPIKAWDEGKDEDTWIKEVQDRANKIGEALAVTQDGRLVMLLNPKKSK